MAFKRGLLRYAVIVNHKLVKGYGLHLFESSTEPDAAAYAEDYVHDAFVDDCPPETCAFHIANNTKTSVHVGYIDRIAQ